MKLRNANGHFGFFMIDDTPIPKVMKKANDTTSQNIPPRISLIFLISFFNVQFIGLL